MLKNAQVLPSSTLEGVVDPYRQKDDQQENGVEDKAEGFSSVLRHPMAMNGNNSTPGFVVDIFFQLNHDRHNQLTIGFRWVYNLQAKRHN